MADAKAAPTRPSVRRALGPQCSLQPDANGSMYGADLQNATMSGQYTYWYFAHAKMSGVKAEMTNFYCSTFTSVTAASYAYVSQGSCVNPAEKTDFASASFVGADLTSANLSGWAAVPTTTQKLCTGGNYTPASTYSPDFSRTNFSNATLTKANLANTVLPSTAYDNYLKGAIWSSTTCPQGNVATGAACSPRSP